jgi:glycerol-3-phosphate dehydrogenase (NAD(P)+)
MNITVFGSGAWGTALANAFARSPKHRVTLWGRDVKHLDQISIARANERYLPGVKLVDELRVESRLDWAVRGAELLLVVTPTSALRETLQAVSQQEAGSGCPIVWACKGFDTKSSKPMMPHEIVRSVMGEQVRIAALSGPSFAAEVARGQPVALCCASPDEVLAARLAREFSVGSVRVYSSGDLVGVELGGALKNVIALAAGISDGLGLGLNARAALITRGIAEMARLGTAMGGQANTFMGLTGLGDLVLTATGELSRNRTVGLRLAKGEPLQHILDSLGHVAEGVRSAPPALALAQSYGVEMPITEQVNAVLEGSISAEQAVKALLTRDVRNEA